MQQQGGNSTLRVAINSNQLKKPTVLVFDSGVGGLSVYQEIAQLLPNLHYIYAFDNAGFPYGEKPEAVIIDRVIKMLTAINQQYPLDLIVIACNTASTVSLPALRERFAIPVVGVVPAIKPAAALTRNGIIGLLATRATIQRSYTHDLIKKFANDSQIKLLGSARLVQIAEDKLQGKPVDLNELKTILDPWLTLANSPDTLVLGCTHFPLLKDELAAVLPKGTQLVDSGAAIARRVMSLLSIKPSIEVENSEIENSEIENCPHRDNKNRAMCSRLDNEAKKLIPVLAGYGFDSLEEQAI